MCGRFTLHTVREALVHRFGVSLESFDLRARYNIAPTQKVLAVRCKPSGELEAVEMQWGLIPSWEPEPRTKLSTINARLESVANSRLYRTPFQKRRCLILADGYYEWQVPERSTRRSKQPYWIHRADREPFAFAGLYAIWKPRDGSDLPGLLSCTILTTEAWPSLREIHGRMPIILQPANERSWADPDPRSPEELRPLLDAEPESSLRSHPVSTTVNSPRHDGPELILDAPQAGF